MKNSKFKQSLMIVTMLVASVGSAWATWTRVTSVSDITSGGTFIIGYEATANSGIIVPMQNSGTVTTSAAGYVYSGTASGSTGSGTIDMSSVTETSAYEVTITASSLVSGAVNIKIGDNYLGNTNTKNNCKLFTAESSTTAFTPTIETNDVVVLKIAANSSYHTLQYNATSGSERFAVYGGTQKNVVLYKNSTPTTNYNVTWNVEGTEYTTGTPTTSVASGSKVTTLPTAPTSSCDGEFVGWSATDMGTSTASTATSAPTDLFTTAAGSPTISANTTFYAVFKKEQ